MWATGCEDIKCNKLHLKEAELIASQADVIVLFLGLEPHSIEHESHDRSTIALPPGQVALVSAMRTAQPSKPIIAVLIHGGVFAMDSIEAQLDAIVDAWYPGQQGGYAVSDVLFGLYNPAGRTPVTWYYNNEQLPASGTMDLYPNPSKNSQGLTYRYFTGKVLFPFGFGLSYTSFAYRNLRINGTAFRACDWIGVTFDVQNTGSRAGDEVVQVYVKQPEASVPVPQVRLAGFDRLTMLQPGETRTVTVTLPPNTHTVVYETGSDVYQAEIAVEKGPLAIYAGRGQPDFNPDLLYTRVVVQNTQDINTC
jgi:beta-glucosidase